MNKNPNRKIDRTNVRPIIYFKIVEKKVVKTGKYIVDACTESVWDNYKMDVMDNFKGLSATY